MTKTMTDKTFNEGMMTLKINFGFDLDKTEEDKAYTRLLKTALAPFPDLEVQRAFAKILRHCKFKPKVADFMELLEPEPRNAAVAAWAEFRTILNDWGAMRDRFWLANEAVAFAVQAIGGWPVIAQTPEKSLEFLKKDFVEAYQTAAERGLNHRPARIVGCRDRDWKTGAFYPLKPIPASQGFSAALPSPDGQEAYFAVLPDSVEKQMAALATAKRMN